MKAVALDVDAAPPSPFGPRRYSDDVTGVESGAFDDGSRGGLRAPLIVAAADETRRVHDVQKLGKAVFVECEAVRPSRRGARRANTGGN